jgi:hypothetical protein
VILDSPSVPVAILEQETGWVIKAQGACRGAMCVPLPDQGPAVTVNVLSDHLGMGIAHDERHGLWALGPSTVSGRALESAEAPDFTLPDLKGQPFRFSSLRGQKVVLVAWASW